VVLFVRYGGIRGTEVHRERSRTTSKQKAVPLEKFSESKATQAIRLFYVMQINSSGFPDWVSPGNSPRIWVSRRNECVVLYKRGLR
jgi:hypothetical protein